MDWAVVGETLVVVHGPEPASASEWSEFCEVGASANYRALLIFTHPLYPGPTAKQRAIASEGMMLRRVLPPVAVVANCTIVLRGIVTIFGWLQKRPMALFPPLRLAEALQHAEVSAAERGNVMRQVNALTVQFDPSWMVCGEPLAQ